MTEEQIKNSLTDLNTLMINGRLMMPSRSIVTMTLKCSAGELRSGQILLYQGFPTSDGITIKSSL